MRLQLIGSALLLGLLGFLGCSHLPKPASRQIASMGAETLGPPLLLLSTPSGENFKAHFSHDGANLIYISKDRTSHKNMQAYEWSFISKKERRITYSDGDVEEAIYFDDDKKIAYISNTDVIKNDPELFRPKTEAASTNNDIFASEPSGLPIEKWTKSDSHSAFLSLANEKTFIFSTTKNKSQQIVTMNTHGGELSIVQKTDDSPLLYPLQNRQHVTIWLEEDKNQLPTIHRQKAHEKASIVNSSFTSIHDISWWDAEREVLLVSGKQSSDNFDNLYLEDLKYQCQIPLFSIKADLWYPSVDTDKKRIAFTALNSAHRQIEVFNLPDSLPECHSPTTADPAPPPPVLKSPPSVPTTKPEALQ